jgi:hypothetical protein
MNEQVDDATRQEVLYAKIWGADPNYGTRERDVIDTIAHRISPHMERVIPGFADGAHITVADFGAGDGRFLRELEAARLCWKATGVDLYEPPNKPGWMKWVRKPMWEADIRGADFAISTDALEHLPPHWVRHSLIRIATAAPHGFIRVSCKEDRYGTERGLHLHETVWSPQKWLSEMNYAGIKQPHSWRIYVDPVGMDGIKNAALEVWY